MKTVQQIRKPNVFQRANGNTGDDIKIAVVDDDMMYRQAIEVSLKKVPGSRVMGFKSGEECFKSYNAVKPDILVLDYLLCEKGASGTMNGIEVLRKVKQVNDKTTVIFLSGVANTDVAVTAIKAGATDFIQKDRNGLSRLLNQVRRASVKIQTKRQETRLTKWIGIGVVCIAVIVLATVMADAGGFSYLWNWMWVALSIGCGIISIRSWVKNSHEEHHRLQNTEYTQHGKWID